MSGAEATGSPRSVGGPPAVTAVVVGIPSRDESADLPGCLDAVAAAVGRCTPAVRVVVGLDGPPGDSLRGLRDHHGVRILRLPAEGVGATRHAAVRAGLTAVGALRSPARAAATWVAVTDADSRVPERWLEEQLALADAGADLVLGTVDLIPDERPGAAGGPAIDLWRRAYRARFRGGWHPHVHGANLGVRASRYLAVGGFPPVTAHEDVALADAVRGLPGARVISPTWTAPVRTSSRTRARAPCGVGADLQGLRETGPGGATDDGLAPPA